MELLQHTYRNSKKRVFFLDYDGTLVAIASKPHLAIPTDKMLAIIRKLASVSRTTHLLTEHLLTQPIGRKEHRLHR